MSDMIERLKPRAEQFAAADSPERLAAILSTGPRPRSRARLVVGAVAAAALVCAGIALAFGAGVFDRTNQPGRQGVTTAECQPLLRMGGVVYAAADYAEGIAAAPAGRAELSTCDDNGADPRGSTFPEEAETAAVFALGDLAVGRVVGVPLAGGFTVYLASDLAAPERQRILDRLDGSG